MKYRFPFFMILVLAVFLLVRCDRVTNPSSGAAAVEANLNAISTGFNPSSLGYSSRSLRPGGDPCLGYDLFSCQPVLLRLYISLAKMFFDMTKNIVSNVKTQVDAFPDGSSGTGQAIEGVGLLDYNKTSANDFTILVKNTDGTSLFYLDVTETVYVLKMNISGMSEGENSGSLQVNVTFTDDTHWTVTVLLSDMECESDDVRAPREIRILMSKADTLWTGKAQMYNPVWLSGIGGGGNPTCNTQGTDNTSMNFYTDFVGDDAAAKAKVYMMRRNITSLANISNYGMDSLCTNYLEGSLGGLSCQQWYSSQNGFDITQYVNPFCNPDSTDVATWDNSCTAYSSTVANTDFGSASDWTVPSEFYQQTVSLPTSLQ